MSERQQKQPRSQINYPTITMAGAKFVEISLNLKWDRVKTIKILAHCLV